MKVTPLHKLLATKAIALMPGLTSAERRIATAIIDHFRKRDGRCDPGIDCLVEELGINRKTVIRGIRKLDQLKLVFKDRFRGHHRTNSYEPNWPELLEIERYWRRRLSRTRQERKTRQSTGQGHSSAENSDKDVTQTCSTNLFQEPEGDDAISKHDNRQSVNRISIGQARRHSLHLNQSLKPINPRESAEQAAISRWSTDLFEYCRHKRGLYEMIVPGIEGTICDAITAAEMHLRGGGLQYIVEHLDELRGPNGKG